MSDVSQFSNYLYPGTAIARELLHALFDNSSTGLVVVDSFGKIILANSKMEQLFGYGEDELIGNAVSSLLCDGNPEQLAALEAAIARGMQSMAGETAVGLTALHFDGSKFPIEISVAPLQDQGELKVMATVRDLRDGLSPRETKDAITSIQTMTEVFAIRRDLTHAASHDKGLAGIAKVVHRVTGGVVMVENYDGSLSVTVGTRDTQLRNAAWHQLHGLKHAHAFRRGEWLIAVACPDDEILGAISLCDPDNSAPSCAALVLGEAAAVLAMEFFRLRTIAEAEVRIWGDLASELLEDTDVERSRRHAIALGYEIERLHRAVFIKRDSTDVGQMIIAIRRTARMIGLDARLLSTNPSGVVLLVVDGVDWEKFADALGHERGTFSQIGVGNLYDLVDLPTSLVEAELALRVGTGNVVRMDELGVLGLLSANADTSRLQLMVDQWIGALVSYDADHGSELTHTLSEFLRNGGAIEATARKLYVHTSSLKYRLGRIRDLTKRDLKDPDERFNLELACRVFAILRSSSAEPAR